MSSNSNSGTAIVTGVNGQDGYFLTTRLLEEGWLVHGTARRAADFSRLSGEQRARLEIHEIDLRWPQALFELVERTSPDEFYNLAGQSSVYKSFADPLYTWQTNAESVVNLLECIRKSSPLTRFYQASSTDMFGVPPDGVTVFSENSALSPQSPYASAKAAAHLLCHSYREVYRLRIASGILSNHESHRRPSSFLSRKVVEHVRSLAGLSDSQLAKSPPLSAGNLKVERDWGFAPDYVEGMCRILRQITTRAEVGGHAPESDEGANYRDYVLATGHTFPVWKLIDSAFTIGGFAVEWNLDGDDPGAWSAKFSSTGKPAVVVDRNLLRAAEPLIIKVDAGRARRELGWAPREGLEVFLQDMMNNEAVASLTDAAAKEA